MARRSRQDIPGSWHHITNRGVSKRPLFETGADARYFLAQLVKQVRIGRIEIHSFSLMTTHFHILARSLVGELSEAMRRAQNEHSRTFNRSHGRDGTLIRGRYFSKPVKSISHRINVVRYIDANPVCAGIVRGSWQYTLGSRAAYARRVGPRWLSRDWVEARVMDVSETSAYSPSMYANAFGGGQAPEVQELVEGRMKSTETIDPLDDLVGSTPVRIQRWMMSKARLADGCKVGLPACGRTALDAAMVKIRVGRGPWVVEDGSYIRSGNELARAGMLRDLCGWPLRAIAQLDGGSLARARRLVEQHRRLVLTDGSYGEVTAQVALEAVKRSAGSGSTLCGTKVLVR